MVFDVLPWFGLAVLGLVVGAFGTLIGAGGGFLLVPVLLLLHPGERVQTITSISLAVVFLNAASGSLAYARLRRIDYRTGVVLAVAGAPGSVLGALSTSFLPRGPFDIVFGLLLIGLGAYLVARRGVTGPKAPPDRVNLGLGATLSVLIGYFSSALGIGGGIIHVPLLIQVLGYPVHIATATSQFILLQMSLVGTLTHLAAGELSGSLRQIVFIGGGMLAGAQLGAALSQRLQGRWIVVALAVALAIVGVRLSVGALLAATP